MIMYWVMANLNIKQKWQKRINIGIKKSIQNSYEIQKQENIFIGSSH